MKQCKHGTIKCLNGRALKLCPGATLNKELEQLKVVFRDNGYSNSIIQKTPFI